MHLIDREEYKSLGAMLSRMSVDFEDAREGVQGAVFAKEDCKAIRSAMLANEDAEEPWIGLLRALRASCGEEYAATLTVALQICNEWDAKVIAEKELGNDRQG